MLPVLNVPIGVALARFGVAGLVVLALELAGINRYLRRRGFAAGWVALAGILSLGISIALISVLLFLALTRGCDGGPCLS